MEDRTLYTSWGLFTVSLAMAMLPCLFRRMKKVKKILPYAIITSAGFMLSSIFTDFIPHLLEDPSHHGNEHDHHEHFNLGLFCSGLSFIMLLAIDVLVLQHSHCDSKEESGTSYDQDNEQHKKSSESCMDIIKYSTSKTQAFFFMIAISMHSFFEGFTLKSSNKKISAEICIFIHKLIESFFLGITVFSAGFSYLFGFFLMFIYSILTPIGIILRSLSDKEKNTPISNIYDGLALGSIMFIVFVEIIPVVFHGHKAKKLNIMLLLSGYSIPPFISFVLKRFRN